MTSITEQDDIASLGLTARSRNALNSVGIHTVGELLQTSDWALKVMPNLGPVSRTDIEAALKRHGLSRAE